MADAEPTPNPALSQISTRWDLLNQAHASAGDAHAAQRQFLARYAGAVYRYLQCGTRDSDAAADLSQEFALRFVRGDFRRADPDRGRFRDFLRTVLYHLVVDFHRARIGRAAVALDSTEEPVAPGMNELDEQFVAEWRQEVLDRTWEALEADQAAGRHEYYTVLRRRAESPEASIADLAAVLASELGRLVNEASARQMVHRARERFAELLLDELARTPDGSTPEGLERELAELGLKAYCQPALDRRN